MVILPYVKGIKELVQLIQKHHEITTAVRPHRNLRKILVHPKDKVEDRSKTNCVYQIPWNTCDMSYISETGRTFGTRLDEHKKEVKTITTRRFTWEKRKWSTNVEHKLAITDHADRHNCVTDWEGRKCGQRQTGVCDGLKTLSGLERLHQLQTDMRRAIASVTFGSLIAMPSGEQWRYCSWCRCE